MVPTHNGGTRPAKGQPADTIAGDAPPPTPPGAEPAKRAGSTRQYESHIGPPRGLRGGLGGGPGGGYEPPGSSNERSDPTPAVPRPSPVADRMEAEALELLAAVLGAEIIGIEPGGILMTGVSR